MSTPLRLGIAGLGTIGCATVNLLHKHAALIEQRAGRPVTIAGISAKNRDKDRPITITEPPFFDDAMALAESDDIDCVVELIGGSEGIAKDLVETALTNGKAVITANKALIAHYGKELAELAEENHAPLAFEAAVAGGIPAVKALKEGLSGNECNAIHGILNGTCNYILSAMKSSGRDFETALQEAQDKGYAEADPSFDVDGIDAAHKTVILSSLAFGVTPQMNAIGIEGIRSITPTDIECATELGCVIKLLGSAIKTDSGVTTAVYPCMVPVDAPLATVHGVLNAVNMEGDMIGSLFLEGPGAGGNATASAVTADIIDIARGIHSYPFGIPVAALNTDRLEPTTAPVSWYVRVDVSDEPGVLADITRIFHGHNISVDVMIQPRQTPGGPASLIMTTHPATAKAIEAVSASLSVMPTVLNPPQLLRILS